MITVLEGVVVALFLGFTESGQEGLVGAIASVPELGGAVGSVQEPSGETGDGIWGAVEGIIDSGWALAQLFGVPVLFVIFILKGALIGKIFPTSLFLPGYVIVTGASRAEAIIIIVATAIGYIIGQFVIYYGSRRYGRSYVERLPYADPDLDSEPFEKFDKWFMRYGGVALFVSNFVPWVRGLLSIPAGTSNYPAGRYIFYTTTSTLIYHAVYVWVALLGLEFVTGL